MAICRYLQETAWHHANHLGFGYIEGREIKHTWVIVRLLVKMDIYPSWEDIITIKTWPRGMDGLLAMRDFEILNADGQRLGAASSQWFIIDTETRKPLPGVINRDIAPIATSTPVMEEQPEKIHIKESLPELESWRARFTDIDMYGHVNNIRYVEWVINAIPENYHNDLFISSFTIEFLSESWLNDEITVSGNILDKEVLIRGVRLQDKKNIFRAKLSFRHKQ